MEKLHQYLRQYIEAIIFTSQNPVSLEEVRECLNKMHNWQLQDVDVQKEINILIEKYNGNDYVFQIVETGGGFQFLTKKEYHQLIAGYFAEKAKRKLSTASMEVLSVVAYKHPVSKTDIERIRGVNCDYTIQRLLEKQLIEIVGRGETPGRPLLYVTSQLFMDYFGINSSEDLPKPKELQEEENEIGIPQET